MTLFFKLYASSTKELYTSKGKIDENEIPFFQGQCSFIKSILQSVIPEIFTLPSAK